jgi:hypothetical protein
MAKEKKEKKEIKITKDICDKVLYLDCRDKENVRRLEKSLMKLPFIKSEEDLTTDNLELLIKKIERKYMIHLSYVMRTVVDLEDHYSGMIKTWDKDGRWLRTTYGQTTWEVFAKSLFFMFFYIEDERRKMRNRKEK